MKQGWEIKKLGEVCEIVGGSTPKTNEPSYWDGEHYWVTPAELDGAKYISSTSRTITDEGVKSAHLQLLPSGTVLLSSRAPIGKVAITTTPMYCNQGFKNLVCSTKLHNEFVYWFLYHRKEYLNSLGTGATFKEISKRVVEQIPIPVPPREEQERIVEILDRKFERIDALKANAEQNLQHAKDLFQSALKQELQPKEGWVTMKLGAFAHMKAGDFIKASDIKDEYFEGAYPCYGGNGLRGYVKEPNRNGEYCLIGRQGALCGNIHIANGVFRATEHAVVVSPYQKMPIKLIYYLLVSLNLNQYSTGAAQPGLSVKNIADNVSISVPPKDIWNSIALRLEIIESNCKALEENYKKTIALCDDMKQALLRKAFNGEL